MRARPLRPDPYDRELPATAWNRWLRRGYLLCGGVVVAAAVHRVARTASLAALDPAVSGPITAYCVLLAWGVGRIRRGPGGTDVPNVLAALHVLAGIAGALALAGEDLLRLARSPGSPARAAWNGPIEAGAAASFFGVLAGPVVGFLFLLGGRHARVYLLATLFGPGWLFLLIAL